MQFLLNIPFLCLILICAMISSKAEQESVESNETEQKTILLPGGISIKGPFTPHFNEWLKDNNFHVYDFASKKLGQQASFGGREHPEQKIKRRPVLFIHGNSDGALAEGTDEWAQGWSASIEHFMGKGYVSAELYAVTYGDRNLGNSLKRSIDCDTLIRLRRFLEAVLQYTGAQKLDIIAHSMGVSLARHIIQGRTLEEMSEMGNTDPELDQCYLGPSLRHRVHTLIGIAGANFGLCFCADEKLASTAPACSKKTGFWAGSGCGTEAPIDECHMTRPPPHRAHCHSSGQYSSVLHRLNAPERPKDAHFVVSLWSTADAITGPTNFAWGRLTSLIPNSDHSAVYEQHSHYSLKWMTVKDQFGFIAEQQKIVAVGNERMTPKKTKNNGETKKKIPLMNNESVKKKAATEQMNNLNI